MATLESIETITKLNLESLKKVHAELKIINGSIAKIQQKCFDRGKVIDEFQKVLHGESGIGGVVAKQIRVMQELETNREGKKVGRDLVIRLTINVLGTLIVAIIFAALYFWKIH